MGHGIPVRNGNSIQAPVVPKGTPFSIWFLEKVACSDHVGVTSYRPRACQLLSTSLGGQNEREHLYPNSDAR